MGYYLCWGNTLTVTKMFQSLGCKVHAKPKSSFLPFQKIEFLGFAIDSVVVVIRLNNNKKQKLKAFYFNDLLWSGTTAIVAARALQKITSSFPATKFGRLHYKNLKDLKQNRNNFNAKICLSQAKDDLRW